MAMESFSPALTVLKWEDTQKIFHAENHVRIIRVSRELAIRQSGIYVYVFIVSEEYVCRRVYSQETILILFLFQKLALVGNDIITIYLSTSVRL